jgi:hypothetical protein
MNIITRKEAAQQGLSRYYTGKPCKHGHVAERQTSKGECIACKRKWDKQNIDYHRSYWAKPENRERRRKSAEKYNRSKKRAYFWLAYYAKNKEKIIQYQREYAKTNKEKISKASKVYRLKNAAALTAAKANRKKHVKKATPFWADLQRISLKHKERVAMTKLTGLEYHVDHRIPLQGENVCGLHIADNLRVIPARDNLAKSNKLQNTLGLAI